jgi:hypothetical protein
MTYEDKLDTIKGALVSYCKNSITENWSRMFDMWLTHEADMVFGNAYRRIFSEYFAQCINSNINTELWIAGKNCVFAITALLSYKRDATINDVLTFIEIFLTEQLNDLTNWCSIGEEYHKATIGDKDDSP